MNWNRRLDLGLTGLAIAAIVAYIVVWIGITPTEIGRSDFTSSYMGGLLWRQGDRGNLYDPQLQAETHRRLIAPDTEGNLPYVNPPLTAVLISPLTFFDLKTAFRIWQVLQLLCLAGAAFLLSGAARTGPRRYRAMVIAFAGVGTLPLGLLGQWDGLVTLALAAGMCLWPRNRLGAGLIIALGFSLAKPHLALGIAAFFLGTAYWRALLGAVTGVLAIGLGSLAAVGTSGMAGFIQADRMDAFRFDLSTFLGFTGAFGAWITNQNLVQIDAAVLTLATMFVCFVIGRRLSRKQLSSARAWSGVIPLSLVASPHLLAHDLSLLVAPVTQRLSRTTGREFATIALGWLLLNGTVLAGLGNSAGPPWGRLEPWALLFLAAICLRRRQPQGRRD